MAGTSPAMTRVDDVVSASFMQIEQHQNRRPVMLVWSEHFDRKTDGIAAERQLKGWNRAKKEALIKGDLSTLTTLAKRRGGQSRSDA
jgi:predicted GIY-YIG superfamily endonuclease